MGATLPDNQFIVLGHLCSKLPQGGFSVSAYGILFHDEDALRGWLREHVAKEMKEIERDPNRPLRVIAGVEASSRGAPNDVTDRVNGVEEEDFGAIDDAFARTRRQLFG